ncbi:MAG TPA: hypothetical protein VN397_04590 [Candidatus Methylomirabilis sp.]|nr:hypothetical protein [Candidatus Methylomirabilis sp.]
MAQASSRASAAARRGGGSSQSDHGRLSLALGKTGSAVGSTGQRVTRAGERVTQAGMTVSRTGAKVERGGKLAERAGAGIGRVGKGLSSAAVLLAGTGVGSKAAGQMHRAGTALSSAGAKTAEVGRSAVGAGQAMRRAGAQVQRAGADVERAGEQVSGTARNIAFASQLMARQGSDRFAAAAATGAVGASEEPTLLELPTRSYTQAEETDEDRERKRQREMMRTMERFTYAGGAPVAAAPEEEETPLEEEGEPETEAATTGTPGTPPAALERAQADAARLQRLQTRARLQAAKQMLTDEAQKRFQAQKMNNLKQVQKLWRVFQGAEMAGSEVIIPLLLLAFQLNVQVINKYLFKIKLIPPSSFPEDVLTGCVDGLVCCAQLFQCLAPFIFLTAIAAAAKSNTWEAFTTGVGKLFIGVLGG